MIRPPRTPRTSSTWSTTLPEDHAQAGHQHHWAEEPEARKTLPLLRALRGDFFCAPFGAPPVLWPFNFLFNLVEYISKPLSHSMRLYGNMYAGEIIFLLLWMLAASHWVGTGFGVLLGLGWAIFHILIVALQAYVFMMLTIVYLSMAHEHH